MTQVAPRLIVGLGNPGPEYSETRHNAGFWFCERLADKLGARLNLESKYHGYVGKVGNVWILLPQTFMNRSGQSVLALAHFFRILPNEILVVHDELDIPPGQLRLKYGGGLGGHNGLKDISSRLSTQDYWRLRVGIGHPGDKSQVANFVLNRAQRAEQELIDASIDRALEAWPKMAAGEWEAATRVINARPPAPKESST
ncbi:aminoacyl-tRNA hydrolase [Viridibacterium curvum]|uniref:Peptidyl-tRNA hydrolase n=1 Tax=Viridibacterium curvum TaxID=1101404 RepID=A0ABP9QZ32_9RHOO